MPTDHVYRRRLLRLADYLDSIPRERFDYNMWIGFGWKGDQKLSCGTTACALGWAATMPAFRRLGLRLSKRTSEPRLGRDGPYIAIRKLFGPRAVACFYPGLYDPVLDADSPGEDATPKQVAHFIRRHVAAEKKRG